MRLIDADALLPNMEQYRCGRGEYSRMVDVWHIEHAPTIEAEPVRHGRWVDKMVRDWHCSECGKKASFDGYCYDDKPNYCPNCGAKMDALTFEEASRKLGQQAAETLKKLKEEENNG